MVLASGRFNSRAPRGARRSMPATPSFATSFQFTCPSRSTTPGSGECPLPTEFQFTCPSRSTTYYLTRLIREEEVSIHAPLAEHDPDCGLQAPAEPRFNSRAPRGARRDKPAHAEPLGEFQFTCPSRSTTALPHRAPGRIEFQFTCPSRSTTLPAEVLVMIDPVSIHVPLAEHDRGRGSLGNPLIVSIHVPLAEHDRLVHAHAHGLAVSIHVPLAEHDFAFDMSVTVVMSFNSRAPRGARQLLFQGQNRALSFQFTCPSRSTTRFYATLAPFMAFQFTCPSRSTTSARRRRPRYHHSIRGN